MVDTLQVLVSRVSLPLRSASTVLFNAETCEACAANKGRRHTEMIERGDVSVEAIPVPEV